MSDFMKYKIIILIIIIISLGQILLSYIENTSRTHAHARAPTYTHTAEPFRLALCDGSVAPKRDGTFRWQQWASLHSNKHMRGRSGFPRFCVFFAYTKIARPTETRTCDRMCFQAIRTVGNISRDDRARIATYSLLTSTDLRRSIV